jgi:hypothetical protein
MKAAERLFGFPPERFHGDPGHWQTDGADPDR